MTENKAALLGYSPAVEAIAPTVGQRQAQAPAAQISRISRPVSRTRPSGQVPPATSRALGLIRLVRRVDERQQRGGEQVTGDGAGLG
jgi:hypothetical protein